MPLDSCKINRFLFPVFQTDHNRTVSATALRISVLNFADREDLIFCKVCKTFFCDDLGNQYIWLISILALPFGASIKDDRMFRIRIGSRAAHKRNGIPSVINRHRHLFFFSRKIVSL